MVQRLLFKASAIFTVTHDVCVDDAQTFSVEAARARP